MRDFYDQDMAQRYLTESVVMCGGVPGFVTHVIETGYGWVVSYKPLLDPNTTLHIDGRWVDTHPLPLGYANWRGVEGCKVIAVTRKAARNWKTGLARNNMAVRTISEGINIPRVADLLKSQALADCALGFFPSFDEAVTTPGGMAWCREFCHNDGFVYHLLEEEPVGKLVDREIELYMDKLYLIEELQESGAHVKPLEAINP